MPSIKPILTQAETYANSRFIELFEILKKRGILNKKYALCESVAMPREYFSRIEKNEIVIPQHFIDNLIDKYQLPLDWFGNEFIKGGGPIQGYNHSKREIADPNIKVPNQNSNTQNELTEEGKTFDQINDWIEINPEGYIEFLISRNKNSDSTKGFEQLARILKSYKHKIEELEVRVSLQKEVIDGQKRIITFLEDKNDEDKIVNS